MPGVVVALFSPLLLLTGLGVLPSLAVWAQVPSPIAALPNGLHQMCSEPEPEGWQAGAGICFWFRKMGNQVVGYYGYPHSGHFIDCISGVAHQNTVQGEALAISWPGEPWIESSQASFIWDDEGHLRLSQSQAPRVVSAQTPNLEVIRFGQATLDLEGFYPYSQAKVEQMQPPPQTCTAQDLVPEVGF